MKGYRAYFHAVSSQMEAKDINIIFDEPINGIATDIIAPDYPTLASQLPTYNLHGPRMNTNSQLQHGVYIVNGRKVVVK